MKRILFFLFAGFPLFLGTANAGIISRDWKAPGDGLLTYDDVNRREWLDLTETQLFQFPGTTVGEKYAAVIMETDPGGRFDQFTIAGVSSVTALAESAGIDVSTTDLVINSQTTFAAIELLGEVGSVNGVDGNRASSGIVVEPIGEFRVAHIIYAPAGLGTRPGPPTAGFFVSNGTGDESLGVWLYRAVPEPSSTILLVQAAVALKLIHGLNNHSNIRPTLQTGGDS